MTRRRLLLYSDGNVYGGGERYLVELARGLPDDRFAVSVVLAEGGALDACHAEIEELGVPVRRLPPIPNLKARGPFLKVLRFFATHRPHLLHFNLTDPRACNGAMTAAWMSLRRRFIVTEHLPHSPYSDHRLPFRHRLAAKHTAVTIVNTDAHRAVVEARPHNRGEVAVVPNGIPDPGPKTEQRRADARAALGFDEDDVIIVGLVGRLDSHQKNPDLFLEAARRVAPERPDVTFVVIGDGPELGNLHQKVEELGLDASVRFYGHRDDSRELMNGLDLLVNTSHYEGMPFSVMEAMYAGVPVLVTDILGVRNLVADHVVGRIVPPGNGDVMADAMRDLLRDPADLARKGAVARERMTALFSLAGMIAATARIYDDLE